MPPCPHPFATPPLLPARLLAHQHKALAHLVVVQEGLVALVDGAGVNLAGAAGAGARAAAVGQVDACRKWGGGSVREGEWRQPSAVNGAGRGML